MHRSRLCHFVVDVPDLEHGVAFWSAALNATEKIVSEQSRHIYRRLRLPDSEIRILLRKTGDDKAGKERLLAGRAPGRHQGVQGLLQGAGRR